MKDFKVRIWIDKRKEMIYPSESFRWVVSLDGEVFYDCGRSIKDKDDCEILPFTGLQGIDGVDIYEGDWLEYIASDKQEETGRPGKCQVYFKDGGFRVRLCNLEDQLDKYGIRLYQMRVVGNKYEHPSRK
jgi:hypothetical protein